METERKFWQQRNKNTWIPNVHRNTQIFHMVVKQRRKKNVIGTLRDCNNHWVSGQDNLSKMLINHFSSNFKKDPRDHLFTVNFESDTQISAEENNMINSIPTEEEI